MNSRPCGSPKGQPGCHMRCVDLIEVRGIGRCPNGHLSADRCPSQTRGADVSSAHVGLCGRDVRTLTTYRRPCRCCRRSAFICSNCAFCSSVRIAISFCSCASRICLICSWNVCWSARHCVFWASVRLSLSAGPANAIVALKRATRIAVITFFIACCLLCCPSDAWQRDCDYTRQQFNRSTGENMKNLSRMAVKVAGTGALAILLTASAFADSRPQDGSWRNNRGDSRYDRNDRNERHDHRISESGKIRSFT